MKMSHYGTYWVSFFKGVLLVLLILALTGCSIGGEKKIKIFSVEKPREKLNYEMPTPLQMEEIKWIIITSANADEVFKDLKRQELIRIVWNHRQGLPWKSHRQCRNCRRPTMLEEYKKYYEDSVIIQ